METNVDSAPLRVERWPTEIPLLVFVALAALAIWFLLALSIFGIVYVVLIGVVLFFARLLFITHIRGSAVKLGPEQFPELYERVVTLARRAGVEPAPEAYLMQAEGALNAFATRFFRARMIVLFADLLEACEGQPRARDMIIGHELGHIRARHLDWIWLLAPGLVVPFLGAAYSRARERTCDRWGAALCGDVAGATTGLAILAAGGRHGPRVNLGSFIAQSEAFESGWMTLGRWLSGYPPLCERVAAISPPARPSLSMRGPVRALLLLGSFFAVPIVAGGVVVTTLIPRFQQALERLDEPPAAPVFSGDVDEALEQVAHDFERLAPVARELLAADGVEAITTDELYAAWKKRYPGAPDPVDPFDGLRYGYYETEGGFVLWSTGPDGEIDTEDDLVRPFTLEPDG